MGLIEYVVSHGQLCPHEYAKKSKSTHEINHEPAVVVPRCILSTTSHLPENFLDDDIIMVNHQEYIDEHNLSKGDFSHDNNSDNQYSLFQKMLYKHYVASDRIRFKNDFITITEEVSLDEETKTREDKRNTREDELLKFHLSLSTIKNDSNSLSIIYRITTPEQLNKLLEYNYSYEKNPMPSSEEMFPYLHGLNNIRQRMFFHDQYLESIDQKPMKTGLASPPHEIQEYHYKVEPPSSTYFNLLTVDCAFFDEVDDINALRSVSHTTTNEHNKYKLVNSICIGDLLTPSDESPRKSLYDDIHHQEDVVNDHIENIEYTPFHQVNDLDLNDDNLNNRNFQLQVKLMAPISHFLLYNSNQKSRKADENVLKTLASLTNEDICQYVYFVDIPKEQWSKINSTFIEPKINTDVQPINSINNQPFCCKLLKLEQNLIWKTYSMKQIFKNVTIGNLIDFSYLTSKKNLVSNNRFKLFINCHEHARFPDLNLISDLFKSLSTKEGQENAKNEAIYLEFPSSGTINCSNITFEETISYLNVLKLINFYTRELNEEIFIFSFDGFTGLSLLTLSLGSLWNLGQYIEDIVCEVFNTLDVKLYFFKNDMVFLKKFEKFIYWFKPSCMKSESKRGVKQIRMVEDLDYKKINQCFNELYGNKPHKDLDWFSLDYDNNFPAKIYSNLYLGSLNHASSKTILNTCKVNKIISIGEKPKWFEELGIKFDYEVKTSSRPQLLSTKKDTIIKSIYSFNNGTAKVYEIKLGDDLQTNHIKPINKLNNLKSIIYIHNVKDDGRDSMLSLFRDSPEHIQNKILINPKDTQLLTLVHCKIGVSRSASLVMASVMKYLEFDILEAYMYVRIRRFNIIIQPNLRIFYELFLYDEFLRNKKGNSQRKYCWANLCDEIFKLNNYYIG